jgi:hypothetical protein
MRVRRICGENLSKRPSVKGHNSSKSTNRKILTLCTSRHHHLALCQVSSKSVEKWDHKSGHRHTHTHTDIQTDTLLTNQDKHPKQFRKFNKFYSRAGHCKAKFCSCSRWFYFLQCFYFLQSHWLRTHTVGHTSNSDHLLYNQVWILVA